ncbi:hypothetical protein M8J76_014761 [Diaphorina citri]|nr:hypothetical protein M8J76_014761 [Diaphorina citri]KAI5752392.1 hypothetical protein M8J77_016606 [Diaphorina citri]
MFVRSNIIKCFLLAIVLFILYKVVVFLSAKSNPEEAKLQAKINLEPGLIPKIPIKVSVYYEALCPDSRHFVLHQLVPVYEKGSRIMDYELVPYGKAKTEELVPPGNRYKFHCQHGSVECHANKIHACAIKNIENKATLLKYVACMINDNYEAEQIALDCSRQHNIDVNPILQCARGVEGEILLKTYGEMTYALTPKVSFIPTILINGNQYNQAHILKNLWGSVCALFPESSQPKECSR